MTRKNIICIGCPKGCRVLIEAEAGQIIDVDNYGCPRGEQYARKEFTNPTRILPTTVKVKNGELPLVSVKTEEPIPRHLLLKAVRELAPLEVEAPVFLNQVIVNNLLGTGVRVIATRNIARINNTSRSGSALNSA